MFQNNPLLAQLKQELHEQTPRIEGIVRAHEKGFGFLDTDSKKSYFIPVAKMKTVCNGDKISGSIISNNDKEFFEPELLIESSLQKFIGKIGFQDRAMVVYPENMPTHFAIRCKINEQVSEKLKEGDWVVATLLSHPLQKETKHFFAEVTRFVADGNSPYQLWLKTLARYDLETHSPQANELTISDTELDNRQDLTDIHFFTIDSENTEDMDDAIAVSKDEQGFYQLMVAIADPTAYILQDSKLDNVAKTRNFTTYLPDFNIPMLPKELANELCSLKANQKRPAMICKMRIDNIGNIINDDTTFMPAWIESKAKLVYNNVSDFLENNGELATSDPTIKQQLHWLADLAKIRITWRQNHALVFKDNGDYCFELDENRQVKSIIKETRRIANHIVEEAMVLANQALTLQLQTNIGFGIFNIHSGFDNKYIEQVVKFLNDNGISEFDKESLLSFDGYIKLRRIIDNEPFLATKLRKFQSPADFSIEPQPHFGLGFDAYATWTSPIRKYGDMVNHRLIKAYIRSQELTTPDKEHLKSMNERRKMLRLAERDMTENLYAQYLANKIDQSYSAEIVDINRGGARVRLCDIGAFAFVPISMIHPIKEEITPYPDEGTIKIKDEVCYKLADIVTVIIRQVKNQNQSIIAKFADEGKK
ncbi:MULTISPECIES: exoribonuclease II [unclassified Gilliamella]|uniref:exoribonuclease II n=1 Tax=unclassified Gilliamella TaxID=2685620 RepID=UPI0013252D7E|nr:MULTISPECIES: exoribonuclease II [unclassified Gilliamella]MWN31651.1 exoribonuclease II [Gilliamella sp. Pra-s60]MWP28758.1 exoribonuclease II [Gilliamella sp. Pra-s54]